MVSVWFLVDAGYNRTGSLGREWVVSVVERDPGSNGGFLSTVQKQRSSQRRVKSASLVEVFYP